MTEMQPTEIELTGRRRKPASHSKRKIFLFVFVIAILITAAILTAILANRASQAPESVQQQTMPVLDINL